MASYVAVKAGILPVGIVLGLGFESGALEIGGQQTVGIDGEQVADVHVLGMPEIPSGNPYRAYGKGLGSDGGIGTDLHGGCAHGKRRRNSHCSDNRHIHMWLSQSLI